MKQFLLIVFTVIATALGVSFLVLTKPEAKKVAPERVVTNVEVITAEPQTVQVTVRSQGTVLPTIESDISVEVSGRITEVSKNFRAGSFFKEGEVLLSIESADYEAALAMREADLASARLTLAHEQALAEQALEDWEAMGEGEASELTLRKPQLAQAKAMVKSAEASVTQAQRDLDRTRITAPYDGLVLSKNVDLGQYVVANPANPIARIYSTELAEVRLPIALSEAIFLEDPEQRPTKVTLYRDTARGRREWTARFARLDATIDPANRLIYAIAELEEPFRAIPGSGQLPMKRGLFVNAEMQGRSIEAVYSLPRYALRGSNSVYIVTAADTLQTREVSIVKSDAERVIINGGLETGDRVAISPIAYFTENMPVNVLSAQ